MQASTTLRRSGFSGRTVAYVIALVAVLVLGAAAAFVAKSAVTPQAAGSHSQGTQVCSSSMCDYQRYDQAPAAQAPSAAWPTEGYRAHKVTMGRAIEAGYRPLLVAAR